MEWKGDDSIVELSLEKYDNITNDEIEKSLDEADFEAIHTSKRLTHNEVFNNARKIINAKKAIQEQGIPFSLKLTDEADLLAEQCKIDLFNARQNAIKNGTSDMSLDEINKVIYG